MPAGVGNGRQRISFGVHDLQGVLGYGLVLEFGVDEIMRAYWFNACAVS
jgi:hypothetical protein